MKPVLRYRLVVDRHSNFHLRTVHASGFEKRTFYALSRYTVRNADLTIVTNESLRNLVDSMGGRGFVLQDRPPRLEKGSVTDLGPGHHIVLVASYATDEPLFEVMESARVVGPGVTIHVTGDSRKAPTGLRESAPSNVRFTGFLSEEDYESLLMSSHGVLALTTLPETILCCAYEAVAVGKPLVVSDQNVLVEYFSRGAVATDNTAGGIAEAIGALIDRQQELASEVCQLAEVHRRDWQQRFDMLLAALDLHPLAENARDVSGST